MEERKITLEFTKEQIAMLKDLCFSTAVKEISKSMEYKSKNNECLSSSYEAIADEYFELNKKFREAMR